VITSSCDVVTAGGEPQLPLVASSQLHSAMLTAEGKMSEQLLAV
jgi:hypothetical protein